MKRIAILLLLSTFIFFNYFAEKKPEPIKYEKVDAIKLCPPSLKVYYRTIQYADKYDVEYYIGFGMVRKETGYRSPFQWTYRPDQISSANAYGSFQILLSTARWFWNDNSITKEDLLYDIDLNTEIGLAYIKDRYDEYGDWYLACGYYNTGYPIINQYAINIVNNM